MKAPMWTDQGPALALAAFRWDPLPCLPGTNFACWSDPSRAKAFSVTLQLKIVEEGKIDNIPLFQFFPIFNCFIGSLGFFSIVLICCFIKLMLLSACKPL